MTRIETNRNQRHILVLDDPRNIKKAFSYSENDIDAVLLLVDTASEVIRIMLDINPIFIDLTCYKPFFASSVCKGEIGRYDVMIDGYADNTDDAAMAEKIEEILTRTKEIGMRRFLSNVDSPLLVFVRVCRFLMTRGINHLTPVLLEGTPLGYISPAFDLAMRLKRLGARDAITYKNMIVSAGMAKNVKFINRVHLCPECFHSHLIYVECCPHCGSSLIRAEEVIHHFRCANISPEHTYNHNGQLRCPKCHEMLRHIGVDYDRPATTYTCQTCNETFVQPTMKSMCSYCGKEHRVEDLIPYDCYEYEFTDEGKKAFVSPKTHLRLQSGYYDNLLPFQAFCNQIELLSAHARQEDRPMNLPIRKVWVSDENGDTIPLAMDVVSLICEQLPFTRIGYQDAILCVREITTNSDEPRGVSAVWLDRFKEVMQMASAKIKPSEKIYSSHIRLTDNSMQALEEFLRSLTLVDSNPDLTFSYSKASYEAYKINEPTREEEHTDEELSQQEEMSSVETSGETSSPQKEKLSHPYSKLWLLLATIVVAVIVFFVALWVTRVEHAPKPVEEFPSKVELQAETKAPSATNVETSDPAEEAPITTKETEAAPKPNEDLRPDKRYIVVAAVFTSLDNARSFASSTSSKIYYKDSNYAVSPFAADDIAACFEYINTHPNAETNPWVWKVKSKDLKR